MNMINPEKRQYLSPSVEVLDLVSDSVLCASATQWYKQGGQGDFDYYIEEEDSWM